MAMSRNRGIRKRAHKKQRKSLDSHASTHHGSLMRLSVNLDPALYESLRAMAFTERSTISAVINRLAREGLEGSSAKSDAVLGSSSRFPVSAGKAGVLLTSEILARAENEAEAAGRFLVNEEPRS
jgi:predicted DNA-binding ribbon-helix-helix protein